LLRCFFSCWNHYVRAIAPLLLIINANSKNPTQIQERQQTLERLLRSAAASAPYAIFLAEPSVTQIAQEFGETPSIEQIRKPPLM
jgi:hypothetical protein